MLAVLAQRLDRDLLMVLAAFIRQPEVQACALEIPQIFLLSPFRPKDRPDVGMLQKLARSAAYDIGNSEFSRSKNGQLSWTDKSTYDKLCDDDAHNLAKEMMEQWPSADFSSDTIHIDDAMVAMKTEWRRAYQNHLLSIYLDKFQERITECSSLWVPLQPVIDDAGDGGAGDLLALARSAANDLLTLPLLAKSGTAGPSQSFLSSSLSSYSIDSSVNGQVWRTLPIRGSAGETGPHRLHGGSIPLARRTAVATLGGMLDKLDSSGNDLRKQYARDLRASLSALCKEKVHSQPVSGLPTIAAATGQVQYCRRALNKAADLVRDALVGNNNNNNNSDGRRVWLQCGNLWPPMTTVSLLEQLRTAAEVEFGPGMRAAFVDLALAVTALQHARRIEDAALRNNEARLQEELRNRGHTNWSPHEHPDLDPARD